MRSEQEQQADALAETEFERLVRKEFERVEYETQLDEVLPADHKTRNSTDTLDRGVDRISDAYLEAIRKCVEHTGRTPAEVKNDVYCDRVDDLLYWGDAGDCSADPTASIITDRQRWLDDMRDDLEGNFIYTEYLGQLFSNRPVAESYGHYCTFVSYMAALRYAAQYPDAIEELELLSTTRSLVGLAGAEQTYRYCRIRDEAIRFLEWVYLGEVETSDIHTLMALAETYVPGIGSLADKLLNRYSKAASTERERMEASQLRVLDTPLPNDPEGVDPKALRKVQRVYAQMRLERAVAFYQNDPTGRGIKEIAKDYGVSNETLRQEIKRLGLTRSWGGDRKAKQAS